MPANGAEWTTGASAGIRAILFDLGETLLDTGGIEPDFEEWDRRDFGAVHAYLEETSLKLPPWETFYQVMSRLLNGEWEQARLSQRGVNISDILRDGFSELGIPLAEVEMGQCLRRHYRWCDESAILYPDVLPALTAFRRQGLRLGLISNTIWPACCHDETLARLGVRDLLDVRLYSADVGYQKPHAAIFRLALNALGVNPRQAVFVGDRLASDVAGAQRMGMKGVLRIVPYRREKGTAIVPDVCITTLAELLETLERSDVETL